MFSYQAKNLLRLRKPLARTITSLRLVDPDISDLIGVLTGAKEVTYTDYSPADWPYLRELCAALGLKYAQPEAAAGRLGKHLNYGPAGRRMLLIAKSGKALRAAAGAWKRSAISRDWGILLGYPACCVDAYIRWRREGPDGKDLLCRTAENTRPGRWDFRLNNIANFFSRIFDKDEHLSRRVHALNLRAGLQVTAAHVASWHPCAYDCPESVRKAALIYDFMQDYLPAYAAWLKALLARPFLYIGKYDFLALQAREDGWGYDLQAVPLGLVPARRAAALLRAETLELTQTGLLLRRGAKDAVAVKTAKKPLLLDFSAS